MTKNLSIGLTLVLAISLSSCASIFCGTKKTILLDANIPQAKSITVDGRKYETIKFPYKVKVKRGFTESIVRSEAEGYAPTNLIIDKTFNPVSVINLTNLFGWAIDVATGAVMKPEYDNYVLDFTEE